MPSRLLPSHPPQPAAPPPLHHRESPLIPPLATATATAFSFLLFLTILYRKLSRKRTTPSDLKPPRHRHRRFSYSTLRRATSSFSPSNRLGQGGFGSVFRGTLKSGQEIAVKLMDSGSLQGEREFQNELNLSGKIESNYCVSLIGFCCERRRRRMLLVYELMHNRSLQDCLFEQKCVELMEWKTRFKVALDIARGLEFLHSVCEPPIIHGDIKPSNILLDSEFHAKIADFGLARAKIAEEAVVVNVEGVKGNREAVEDNGSIVEENESVATGFDEVNCAARVSPESFVRATDAEASPDATTFEASPSEVLDKSVSDGNFDKVSLDSRRDLVGSGSRRSGKKKSLSGKDWWWKQDNGGGSESGRVKDYVMEWIGTEIKKERPKSDWISTSDDINNPNVKPERKKQQKRLDWWSSLDSDGVSKKEKSRPAREWWREEFCDELAKKKKKREMKLGSSGSVGDAWWQRDDDSIPDQKKKKSKSRGSRSSIDWWLDGLSGEFRIGRRNSQDWTNGEVTKSGGISSTPSMRGTVCYVAPEYGGGGQLSEKCDVYSYGVLILVLVSGRRPLQVTASPMSEFERANLISWARHLAQRGKLQDLFDPALQSLDQEQALRCVTVALLCLQRSPAKRPSTKEIAAILSGEAEPPHLPVEFSPSPPSNFPFKSRKKARYKMGIQGVRHSILTAHSLWIAKLRYHGHHHLIYS